MLKYVFEDIVSMVRYFPWGLAIGTPMGMVLVAILTGKGRRKKGDFSAIPIVIFCVYVAVMMCITFLSRESGSRIGVDLELFSTWGINERNNAYVVENVILFIPYGYLCCRAFADARKLSRCTLAGTLTSLGIEGLQLVTGRGYFQIDDILTNIMGTIIGFILFRILWWLKSLSSHTTI